MTEHFTCGQRDRGTQAPLHLILIKILIQKQMIDLVATKLLCAFGTAWVCESAFSTLDFMKTKHRSSIPKRKFSMWVEMFH